MVGLNAYKSLRFSLRFAAYCSLVTRSMPLAHPSRICPKHSHKSDWFIKWNRLLNRHFESLWALLAMRCSFVSTGSSLLSMICMSPQHRYHCNGLSYTGITRHQRYYAIVRLPVAYRWSSFCYHLFHLTRSYCKKPQGLPGCRLFSVFNMPSSQTPGKQNKTCHPALSCIGFQVFNPVALPGHESYRGSIRSAYAYGLLLWLRCA